MHPFQILGNPLFMALAKSKVIHVSTTNHFICFSHPSVCGFVIYFNQITDINSNGITTTIECNNTSFCIWLKSGFFIVFY
jgi:hypothetical protein